MYPDILLNAPKIYRTHVYCQQPYKYDICCPICKKLNITWSEFEYHIWCYDCNKDILLSIYDSGIFSGPIPVGISNCFGICFDRICIKDNSIVKFDNNDLEAFNTTWIKNEELEKYLKEVNEKIRLDKLK